jgi:hypothetical protein
MAMAAEIAGPTPDTERLLIETALGLDGHGGPMIAKNHNSQR